MALSLSLLSLAHTTLLTQLTYFALKKLSLYLCGA